jgi:hypothetical protein
VKEELLNMVRNQQGIPNINQIHEDGLIEHFTNGIGQRTIILSPSYPFMFIGEIINVMGDIVEIFVETTHFAQLENRPWFIHIDNIEVFYIERDGDIQIPKLDDIC